MGQFDNQSQDSNLGETDPTTAENVLRSVTQDLKDLQQSLIVQLGQDIARLQAEKSRLTDDIEKLRLHHQQLQSQQITTLSQQQMAQQQLWAKQLAQVLAAHLQQVLMQQVEQKLTAARQLRGGEPLGVETSALTNGYSDSANQLLASLDVSFSNTFQALQQELNSYQSSLSQQLHRMHTLEQQGEVVLEALVNRLRDQLQAETARPVHRESLTPAAMDAADAQRNPVAERAIADPSPQDYSTQPSVIAKPIPLEFPAAPLRFPLQSTAQLSHVQLGFVLVMLSTIALSIHNVIVGIVGNKGRILPWLFGGVELDKILTLNLGNSLLLLLARMVVVLPLMFIAAGVLYPAVWGDIKRFLTTPDRRPLATVIVSGGFLFLSQILIYIAINQIGPGPAVTILFMYPIVTVPLAWFFFGDRPTTLRWAVMVVILTGVVCTRFSQTGSISGLGVSVAVASGICFAFYLIFMQLGFKKLHPVPVSLMQFATIFVLSTISLSILPSLPIPKTWQIEASSNWIGFLIGGLILGILTLAGYLLNNFGVRFMGAARASIVASSGPAMTALLALLITPNAKTILQWPQIIGIVLVTLGVTALSFERMLSQVKVPKVPKPAR